MLAVTTVVVAGGSSAGTPALWRALAAEPGGGELRLVLAGRDARRLASVERACGLIAARSDRLRLESRVLDATADWASGAQIVVVQVRAGGFAERDFDERFPVAFGICGDEGLGPGGLAAGLRNWRAIRPLLEQIQSVAPEALVLMLSSPLGLQVRASRAAFPHLRTVGICELPWTTLEGVCSQLGTSAGNVDFDYFGTNHLGWFSRIQDCGGDLLQKYAALLGSGAGFPSAGLIAECGGLPLKYARLHYHSDRVLREQAQRVRTRGAELADWSDAAFAAYRDGDHGRVLAALEGRDTPWYGKALAPLLRAWTGQVADTVFFLSVPNEGSDAGFERDDVLELPHVFEAGELRSRARKTAAPAQQRELVKRFVAYERAATEALLSGELGDLERALTLDPWTSKTKGAPAIARVIHARGAPRSDGAVTALVMAGGRSERMRRSGDPLHKALLPVLGITLLERNLRMLAAHGFEEVVVAVCSAEREVGEFVATLAARSGGPVPRVFWEATPLGTIGAACEAIGASSALLVVNVDNLTSLPLNDLVAFHRASASAMTIAAHQEPFKIPFGELVLDGDQVREYREKPVHPVWISSGTYVLSPAACERIARGQRTDVNDLVTALLAAGLRVSAFRHEAWWIDVNTKDALERAEQLLG
jgi:alpha-galactosidase/6-phospho-beta-glucosidase family protein/CTP:molybdopterin cytidylyltransferase MocA